MDHVNILGGFHFATPLPVDVSGLKKPKYRDLEQEGEDGGCGLFKTPTPVPSLLCSLVVLQQQLFHNWACILFFSRLFANAFTYSIPTGNLWWPKQAFAAAISCYWTTALQ